MSELIDGKDAADCSAVELQAEVYRLRDQRKELAGALAELRSSADLYQRSVERHHMGGRIASNEAINMLSAQMLASSKLLARLQSLMFRKLM